MSDKDVKLLRTNVARAAWEYGKVGLLIDDSRECVPRVARALYGGETLPEWWVLARSIECACEALSEFIAIFGSSGFTNLRGLVLIDRYLPARCGDPRAIPWDEEDYPLEEGFQGREHLIRMREIVRELWRGRETAVSSRALDPSPDYLVSFFTSFPALSAREAGNAGCIPWQKRGLEMLQEERRDCLKASYWRRLLRYGPEADARITRETAPPPELFSPRRAQRAKWRADTWEQNLVALSQLLGRAPIVLMTGAGCSLATSPVSPGMPPTGKILARVCREMDARGALDGEEWIPRAQRSCMCHPLSPFLTPDIAWKQEDGLSPVDWFLKKARDLRGIDRLDWKLEILFSLYRHKGGGENRFHKFHRTFRELLYRTDYGFAYHHWLLARLPWDSLITTNFDGFHERAALAVAQNADRDIEERFNSLRLGTLWKQEDQERPPKARGALFKPYGSLYSPNGEIVLGQEDIEYFRSGFDDAFDSALMHARHLHNGATGGALVVIGHSMRDPSIEEIWRQRWEKSGIGRLQILWIDPSSYDRCLDGRGFWESKMRELVENRQRESQKVHGGNHTFFDHECSGPVPAKAHELIADLWALYTLDREEQFAWFS
jgi:hypothetical protein